MGPGVRVKMEQCRPGGGYLWADSCREIHIRRSLSDHTAHLRQVVQQRHGLLRDPLSAKVRDQGAALADVLPVQTVQSRLIQQQITQVPARRSRVVGWTPERAGFLLCAVIVMSSTLTWPPLRAGTNRDRRHADTCRSDEVAAVSSSRR